MDDASYIGEAQESIHMGLMYTQQGKYERAVFCFDAALMLLNDDDERTKVYNRRANLHRHLGHTQEAIEDYSAVIAYTGNSILRADALNQRGDLLTEEQQYERAIEDFTAALTLHKDNTSRAEIYYNRGRAYDYLDNFEKAVDDYSATINLLTSGTTKGLAYGNRATIYDKQDNYGAAIADYTAAIPNLSSQRHKAMTYYNRGNTYRKSSRLMDSFDDLNRAIMLYPVDRGIDVVTPMPWNINAPQQSGKMDMHNLALLDPWQAVERVELGSGVRMVSRCIALVYYFKALLAQSSNDRDGVYRHMEHALGSDWHVRLVARCDVRFSALKNDLYWKSLMTWHNNA